MRRGDLTRLAFLALLAVLLVACGSAETAAGELVADDHNEEVDHEQEEAESGHAHEADVEAHEEDQPHELTTHEAIDGANEIRVVAKEWGFELATLHLHEGEAINIVLVNEGALEHEVELDAFDFHLHAEAGETVTVGFVPDQTGEFEFACFVPGHYEAGMVGDLIVEHAH